LICETFRLIKLAEALFKSIEHCNDRQTFVMIAPILHSIVIKGRAYFWRANFKLPL